LKNFTNLLFHSTKEEQIKNIETFFKLTKHKREYTAEEVANLRTSHVDSIPTTAIFTARRMRDKLSKMSIDSTSHFRSLGCLNPTQARALSEATYNTSNQAVDGIYISGWQEASSGENTYSTMFPDQSIYPVNSVPEKIKKMNNVLIAAERVRQEKLRSSILTDEEKEKLKDIQYQVPIIADMEAGFGQEIHTFQLAVECIKAGVACVHLEDQDGSLKKCGHMGGKVKVSISQFINKLKSIRLAADVLGADTVIIARTDAMGTQLINNVSNKVDRTFCYKGFKKSEFLKNALLGSYFKDVSVLYDQLMYHKVLEEKVISGKKQIVINHDLYLKLLDSEKDSKTFNAIISHLKKTLSLTDDKAKALYSFFEMTPFLATADGYYRYNASLDAAIKVGLAVAPYCDLIWFETAHPSLEDAKIFATEIHKKYPGKMFHYNCSPSFNWKKNFVEKYGDDYERNLKNFGQELAKLGFKSQKITLFGMHVINQAMKDRVNGFQENGMLGYSRLQEEEKESGNQSLEHQSFVGVNVWADVTMACTDENNELLATQGESATMDQFE
tara:strand:- start:7772 stop:9442 length:1671 start_codon:yes stop_codon:yes gene_type:complete